MYFCNYVKLKVYGKLALPDLATLNYVRVSPWLRMKYLERWKGSRLQTLLTDLLSQHKGFVSERIQAFFLWIMQVIVFNKAK